MSISNKTLRLQQVSVAIKQHVILDALDLTLESQQIYTVLGPSGSGKSTLLKVIAGLLPFTSGELIYDGVTFVPRQHKIGLVPQNYGLLPWQTSWQAVASAVKIGSGQKKLTAIEEQRLHQLFNDMDLTELKSAYPSEMSGGQQQRVSIARAFASESEFLLMDEPFSALDAFTREKAQELFLATWQKAPRTTLFITHDIEEALLLGHQIVLMTGKPGKVLKVWSNQLRAAHSTLANLRESEGFYDAVRQLRKELQVNG